MTSKHRASCQHQGARPINTRERTLSTPGSAPYQHQGARPINTRERTLSTPGSAPYQHQGARPINTSRERALGARPMDTRTHVLLNRVLHNNNAHIPEHRDIHGTVLTHAPTSSIEKYVVGKTFESIDKFVESHHCLFLIGVVICANYCPLPPGCSPLGT